MTIRFKSSKKLLLSSCLKHGLYGLVSIAAAGALLSNAPAAHAARTDTGQTQTQDAPAQDDPFVPTSAWLVGPATLAPAEGKAAPCVMANQFNNGFLFRFSGGGQKLYAMAVDFRQPSFTPGQTYAVDLSFGDRSDKTVNAEAFDAATLLINLQKQPEIYKQVAKGGTMRLGIGRKNFEFALLGTGEGLKRLETCFSPANADDQDSGLRDGMQSHNAPHPAPIARDTDTVDPGYEDAMKNTAAAGRRDALPDDSQPVDAAANNAQAASLGMHSLSSAAPAVAPDAQAPAPDANGPTGLVDRMLKKAAVGINALAPASGAMGGGTDLQTALTPQPPKMAVVAGRGGVSVPIRGGGEPDARYQSITDTQAAAINAASGEAPPVPSQSTGATLAKSWTATAVQPRDIIDSAPRSVPLPRGSAQQVAAAPDSGVRQWRAMDGSNLRDILSIWAQNEHVKLVWGTTQEYSVKQSLSQQGDFAGAVQSVLQQYNGDSSRPVGQLYRDANTGQKVLVIRQDQPATQ